MQRINLSCPRNLRSTAEWFLNLVTYNVFVKLQHIQNIDNHKIYSQILFATTVRPWARQWHYSFYHMTRCCVVVVLVIANAAFVLLCFFHHANLYCLRQLWVLLLGQMIHNAKHVGLFKGSAKIPCISNGTLKYFFQRCSYSIWQDNQLRFN